MYNELPIHKKSDVKINIPDISKILNIDINKSKDIFNQIELLILNKKLDNNYDIIKKYIEKHFK